MDYRALAAEILLPAYAGMTDAQIVSALLAPVTEAVDVPAQRVRGVLLDSAEWGGLVMLSRKASGTGAPDALLAVAITAVDALSTPGLTLSMSIPAKAAAVRGMIDALVMAGAVSAASRAAMLALAVNTTARAAQVGCPEFSIMTADSRIAVLAYARRV